MDSFPSSRPPEAPAGHALPQGGGASAPAGPSGAGLRGVASRVLGLGIALVVVPVVLAVVLVAGLGLAAVALIAVAGIAVVVGLVWLYVALLRRFPGMRGQSSWSIGTRDQGRVNVRVRTRAPDEPLAQQTTDSSPGA